MDESEEQRGLNIALARSDEAGKKAASQKIEYSDYLPSSCPPSDAQEGPHIVYRLVRCDPPTARCILTPFEENKHPDGDPCLRCAISTFDSKEAPLTSGMQWDFFVDI